MLVSYVLFFLANLMWDQAMPYRLVALMLLASSIILIAKLVGVLPK
mgnify:CR=1 FL=1